MTFFFLVKYNKYGLSYNFRQFLYHGDYYNIIFFYYYYFVRCVRVAIRSDSRTSTSYLCQRGELAGSESTNDVDCQYQAAKFCK